ncbi:MAG: hypothetical protein KF905_12295 [Flavobacteriales bacterium]|nr:hypothetical protein [Flavobacteriales bacterium]
MTTVIIVLTTTRGGRCYHIVPLASGERSDDDKQNKKLEEDAGREEGAGRVHGRMRLLMRTYSYTNASDETKWTKREEWLMERDGPIAGALHRVIDRSQSVHHIPPT